MYKVVDGGWCQKEKRYKELIEVKLIVDINKNKSFQKSQMQKKPFHIGITKSFKVIERRQSQLGQFYLTWT